MRIFTHVNVDIDAVSSVWGAREFIPGAIDAALSFRPLSWSGEGAEEGDLILDIDAGGMGLKGRKDGDLVHSCFESIVSRYASTEDQRALSVLVDFVDAQDTHGSAIDFFLEPIAPGTKGCHARNVLSLTNISSVLRAFQSISPKQEEVVGDRMILTNDRIVIERMSDVFSGMLKTGRSRIRAVDDAKSAEWFGDGRVALISPQESGTNSVLFSRGAILLVFHKVRPDGMFEFGVLRQGDCKVRTNHPEIQRVVKAAGEIHEWFAHSAGFLFCRGSRTSPASTPSKVDPRELALACVRALDAP